LIEERRARVGVLLLSSHTRLGVLLDSAGHGARDLVAATHPGLGSLTREYGRLARPLRSSANVLSGVRPDLAQATGACCIARMDRVDEAEADRLVL
jgi:hypothetical protein